MANKVSAKRQALKDMAGQFKALRESFERRIDDISTITEDVEVYTTRLLSDEDVLIVDNFVENFY